MAVLLYATSNYVIIQCQLQTLIIPKVWASSAMWRVWNLVPQPAMPWNVQSPATLRCPPPTGWKRPTWCLIAPQYLGTADQRRHSGLELVPGITSLPVIIIWTNLYRHLLCQYSGWTAIGKCKSQGEMGAAQCIWQMVSWELHSSKINSKEWHVQYL